MNFQKSTKNRNALLGFLPFILFITTLTFAQSEKSRALIKKNYDFSKIGTMQVDLEFDYESNRSKTLEIAKRNNWKIKETLPGGKKIELQEIGQDGSPIYYETYTDDASMVSRANALHTNGLMDLDLDGEGMQVGVWDAGVARTSHQEYDMRARIADDSEVIDSHATLVTGSIISAGINKEAKGVAYKANVLSHDWARDKLEAAEAAANGLLLSNHSYGIKSDMIQDWYFGAYIKVAQDWDRIMYNAPYYLMVSAAGNARHGNDNTAPIFGTSQDGFDVLLGFTLAKNGLTVAGACTEIDRNGNLKKAEISAYSSFGPVDDGRIKPDLAGNGSPILSTTATNNSSYNVSSGTSMAAPGVTGSLLLLQQYNEQLYGAYLKAATLKGLALHTADDIDAAGPDYKMGWGIINVKTAAEVLLNKDFISHISEETLTDGETFTITVEARGEEALKASISWTDPESEYINGGVLNDKTAALVNDLDIRISQDGKTFFPWKLNPAMASAPATQGDNLVDPFERIEIPNAKGTYTISITHKGTIKNGAQDFSLIVTGVAMNACSLTAPESIVLSSASADGLQLNWDEILDGLYEVEYKKETDQNWITEYATVNSISLSGLVKNQDYVLRLRTFCSQNIASDYSVEYEFTFMGEETPTGLLYFNETLNTLSEQDFTVYPNPAVDQISLNTEVSDTAMYRIISALGVELKVGKAKVGEINVADLATGVYILQIQDFGIKKSAKFYKN